VAIRAISTEGGSTRGNFTHRTVLDGREYLLKFRWNGRAGKWYLSLYDQDESPIYEGIKLVVNFPLLGARVVDERRPPGELMALDPSSDRDPGLYDLGTRVILQYIDAENIG
jgi:hypothetical protein